MRYSDKYGSTSEEIASEQEIINILHTPEVDARSITSLIIIDAISLIINGDHINTSLLNYISNIPQSDHESTTEESPHEIIILARVDNHGFIAGTNSIDIPTLKETLAVSHMPFLADKIYFADDLYSQHHLSSPYSLFQNSPLVNYNLETFLSIKNILVISHCAQLGGQFKSAGFEFLQLLDPIEAIEIDYYHLHQTLKDTHIEFTQIIVHVDADETLLNCELSDVHQATMLNTPVVEALIYIKQQLPYANFRISTARTKPSINISDHYASLESIVKTVQEDFGLSIAIDSDSYRNTITYDQDEHKINWKCNAFNGGSKVLHILVDDNNLEIIKALQRAGQLECVVSYAHVRYCYQQQLDESGEQILHNFIKAGSTQPLI